MQVTRPSWVIPLVVQPSVVQSRRSKSQVTHISPDMMFYYNSAIQSLDEVEADK